MKYFNSNFIIPILKLGMNGLSSKRVGCIGQELDDPVYWGHFLVIKLLLYIIVCKCI